MCELPPKKPNIEEKKPKSQTIFLTPTTSKESQICEIWRQKRQSGNPVCTTRQSTMTRSHRFAFTTLYIIQGKTQTHTTGIDDEMDADFAHLTQGNLARQKRWKQCSFLRQGSEPERSLCYTRLIPL